jgi:hypothetical protein
VLTGLGPGSEEVSVVLMIDRLCLYGNWGLSVHLTIGSGNDNNSTIHVGGTSNHVLDVIGVTGAVDVGVVTVVGGELDVSSGDGDTTLTLLRSLVNGTILEEGREALGGLVLGDGGSQSGLGGPC